MEGTLSGSITLKRLKKGLNVVLSIETENAALYQGWNDKTSTPAPDFKDAANQPILVPKAVATNGQTATITNGSWYYNNTLLVVTTTATSEGFYKCSDARFAINPSNYKLRIIDNIASASNTSNDMFTFKCSGEAANTDYESEATAELHLQIVGSSAAALYIEGGCTLSKENASTKLKARFFIDGAEIISGYSYRFYNENSETLQNTLQDSTSREFTATRDMIDGIGGIYCSAYKTGDSKKTALATDFHKITDIGDEYELEASVDKDWDGVNAQNVTAHVYRFSAGEKGEDITSTLTGTFTHTFASSLNNTELGTKTGVSVEVGTDIWGKIANDNEDVRDFISYKA
jgi:hypothetical protein